VSLPGADELFRATVAGRPVAEPVAQEEPEPPPPTLGVVRRAAPDKPSGSRRPTGRERHDEKITVYVSPAELVDLERARLTLRAEHSLAVDRGRIVREALAVVLADLDAKGADSILVRRLQDH
jgi:hypothetical protein